MADNWTEHALCRTPTRSDWFQPAADWWYADNNINQTRAATYLCTLCDVKNECLETALIHDERFGIWGAKNPTERRLIRTELGLPPPPPTINHGTEGGYKKHRRLGQKACLSCTTAQRLSKRNREQKHV